MSVTTDNSSFLSNTLKRRQQKRQEVKKILQEGISSLHLSSSEQQSQTTEGIYPLINIDPESYLLDEGEERSMLEPRSSHNPDFKQTINVLLNWMNSILSKDSIIIRSFEDDLYDGYILGKLIKFYQPNIRLLYDEIPLSEEIKKQTLRCVLNYFEETCLNQQTIKWTFEKIYNRDLISILHLLLMLIKFFNVQLRFNLPKTLLLKIIVVKKINGLLQTNIINECFIDDDHELISTIRKNDNLIDDLFDFTSDKFVIINKILLNFLNNHLKYYQIKLKQINFQDFQDGLYLLYLISHLENYFLIMNKYYHKKPITREQSYINLQLVFQLMSQAGINIEQYCRINDLLTGDDQRTLYRLLFQLYLKYNPDSNNLLQSMTYIQPIRSDADSPFL